MVQGPLGKRQDGVPREEGGQCGGQEPARADGAGAGSTGARGILMHPSG